ncbi:hypothetical protein CLM76_09315 [Vreelandella venusta]|nr:hypothetical protein CLM76_09315 [Halomonas hydrothermalis]
MASKNRSQVTVDPAGKAGFYQHQTLPGWEVLGTVSRGDDTGALVRNANTGIYAMANAGAIRSLDQRKVRAALGIDERGRPSQMDDGKRRNVYMSDADNAYLKNIGNGNVSEGLRIVTEAHKLLRHGR